MPTPLRNADPRPASQLTRTEASGLPNEAVSLHAYLLSVHKVLKAVPATWVKCEINKLTPKGSVTELELIETGPNGPVAKVRAVIWPNIWRRIKEAFAANGLGLEAGSKVLIQVRPRLQPGFGFDLEADDIDVNFALGDLAARVKKIREDLKAAGLYDRQRELSAVTDFRRVCVIAPAGAAGRADFIRIAEPLHNHGLVEIVLLDAMFQSANASESIRSALRSIYRECKAGQFSAVALVRGGGASADLAHLICPDLSKAVCLMPVPVLVGIGHDVDRGLLDEVAHRSFPTPTAVAAHIWDAVVSGARAADNAIHAIRSQAATSVAQADALVARAATDVRERSRQALDTATDTLRQTRWALDPDARHSLDYASQRLTEQLQAVYREANACREDADERVSQACTEVLERSQKAMDTAKEALRRTSRALGPDARQSLDSAARGLAHLVRDASQSANSCREEAEARVRKLRTGIEKTVQERLKPIDNGLAVLRSLIETTPAALLADAKSEVKLMIEAAEKDAGARVGEAEAMTEAQHAAVLAQAQELIRFADEGVTAARNAAAALDPRRLLASGYSILRDVQGRPLTTSAALQSEPEVRAELADGTTTLRPVTSGE